MNDFKLLFDFYEHGPFHNLVNPEMKFKGRFKKLLVVTFKGKAYLVHFVENKQRGKDWHKYIHRTHRCS